MPWADYCNAAWARTSARHCKRRTRLFSRRIGRSLPATSRPDGNTVFQKTCHRPRKRAMKEPRRFDRGAKRRPKTSVLDQRGDPDIDPAEYSMAEVIGYLKGKSSIWIAQNVERKLRNFLGHKFWARGYFVSTVGRDEETIRAYIKNQEIADKQLDQLQLKLVSS